MWRVWLLATSACSFSGANNSVPDGKADADFDAKPIDAKPIDAPPDAQMCFGTLFPVCLTSLPTMDFTPAGPVMINTGMTDAADCNEIIDSLCVISGMSITINVALTATGNNPLVLVSLGDLTIGGMGSIDVASHSSPVASIGAGHDPTACLPPSAGTANAGGGGGGGGGGFGTAGGNGGAGMGNAGTGGALSAATTLRGGCTGASGGDGQVSTGGPGGRGGGAVYVVANGQLSIMGSINASGAGASGGQTALGGGGGGGAGGMIAIDGGSLMFNGKLMANGGGGGGGGDPTMSGKPGHDPDLAHINMAAGGGMKGASQAGNGGNGGSFDAASAAAPMVGAAGNGAGGGGGSVGALRVSANLALPTGNTVSPQATH